LIEERAGAGSSAVPRRAKAAASIVSRSGRTIAEAEHRCPVTERLLAPRGDIGRLDAGDVAGGRDLLRRSRAGIEMEGQYLAVGRGVGGLVEDDAPARQQDRIGYSEMSRSIQQTDIGRFRALNE